jgi:V8-like Glu-specific endopeptidase
MSRHTNSLVVFSALAFPVSTTAIAEESVTPRWKITRDELEARHASNVDSRPISYDMRTGAIEYGTRRAETPPSPMDPRIDMPPPPFEVGDDDDSPVSDTTVFPATTAVKLEIQFDGVSGTGNCSGTMVGPHHVMTAAHCIYDYENGHEWATAVKVIPALNGTEKPFGEAFAANLHAYTGYTSEGDPFDDLAFVALDRDLGEYTGYLPWLVYGSLSSYEDEIAEMNAYPMEDWGDGKTMYHGRDYMVFATDEGIFHELDMTGGSSGAGLFVEYDDFPCVVGINAYSVELPDGDINMGARLNEYRVDDLEEIQDEDDDPTNYPDLVDGGSSVAQSTLSPGASVSIAAVVANHGTAPSPGYDIRYYLSRSETGERLLIGTGSCDGTEPFSACAGDLAYTAPSRMTTGSWSLISVIDETNAVHEFSDSNNSTVLGTFAVQGDDDPQDSGSGWSHDDEVGGGCSNAPRPRVGGWALLAIGAALSLMARRVTKL